MCPTNLVDTVDTLSAGTQGQHGDKDESSNWRDPPRPIEKSVEQPAPVTGEPGEWGGGERESSGSVVATKRGNARGAKGPCCSWFLQREKAAVR